MKGGVIADFDITQAMLGYFIEKSVGQRNPFLRPRVVISVPTGVTAVEERAVREAAVQAGAKDAFLIEEPMAAAVGAGLPVHEPTGNLIVDIGGGTTEVAVVSLGGIVTSKSVRIAGDNMDEAIMQHLKRNYNLLIGERTAEEIKINLGSALWEGPETSYEVRGRDLISGLPKNQAISSGEINSALSEVVSAIIEAIKVCLERTPPELASDIMDKGIVLAGGGSLLRGIDQLISMETNMPVYVCEEPLSAVARGTGKVLENIDVLRRVLRNPRRHY